MNETISKARTGIDPYLDWLKAEGVSVVNDYAIYLFDVETKMWRNLRTPRTMYAAPIYGLPMGILLFEK